MKSLEEASVSEKRVLLRIDTNLPIDEDGSISDDFRLKEILPTLNYLINKHAEIVIIGHLGRPEGKIDPKLSLRPIFQHLSKLINLPIIFVDEIFGRHATAAIDQIQPGEVVALENLRFDEGEEKNSRTFAQKLAKYGDIYVDDAFSVAHRESASNVGITEFLPSYAGFLLEKEIKMLTELLSHPERPFVAIIGGAKIADKLPMIKNLLERVDYLIVGGRIATNFLVAQGVEVKKSIYDKELLEETKVMLKRSHGKIILPDDYIWDQETILDFGPRSTEKFVKLINHAHTIFWSGPMGKFEDERFQLCSKLVAQALTQARATTVIGGGDTANMIHQFGDDKKISFISTGGSALLEFLSGKVLPGIEALN